MTAADLAATGIWLSARDLAAVYRIPLGTVYGWASTDHWQRTTTWPRKYSLGDAQASYERRRGAVVD
jgi:hypothetical protein